jgi:hypothetical protein
MWIAYAQIVELDGIYKKTPGLRPEPRKGNQFPLTPFTKERVLFLAAGEK